MTSQSQPVGVQIAARDSSFRCYACGAAGGRRLSSELTSHQGKGRNGCSQEWYACPTCGACCRHALWSTEESSNYHATRMHGNKTAIPTYHGIKKAMYLHVLKGLQSRGINSGNLLDVGTAFGGLLVEARQRGFRVWATELMVECIKHLQLSGIPVQKVSSLSDYSNRERTYDAISMLDVNYYFADQPLELKHAWELLSPGGILVIRTTNRLWLMNVARFCGGLHRWLGRSLFRRATGDHQFVQSPSGLCRLLRGIGFRDIHVEADPAHRMNRGLKAESRVAYTVGAALSRILKEPCLVPGVFIWGRK